MLLGPLPFASLIVEPDTAPLKVANGFEYVETFLQDGGGFALLGLWVVILVGFVRSAQQLRSQGGVRIPVVLLAVAVLSTGLYAAAFTFSWIAEAKAAPVTTAAASNMAALYEDANRGKWWNYLFTAAGAIALLGILVPFLRDMLHMSFRRIWALAVLSFREAWRRRILLVFLVLLLLPLFPVTWFDRTIKPEAEISTTISSFYTGATPLLLLAAGLLASFSIPTDIRNQTIHTIVTKPVEKFEIVVGRFLGYIFLLSLVLFGFVGLSLGLLFLGRVSEEAREESMKARVPIYGNLEFRKGVEPIKGESVGREWDYRSYIQGGRNNPFRAVWMFPKRELDSSLATRDSVTCEFEFDIFRTTKGTENAGVLCSFFVVTHQSAKNLTDLSYLAKLAKSFEEQTKGLSKNAGPDASATPKEQEDWKKIDKVAGELGYFEFTGKEVVDEHTLSIRIPSSLFKKALEGEPEKIVAPGKPPKEGPALYLLVRCDSPTQFLGVATHDLYFLAQDRNFALNFMKGAMGLWLRLILVVGVAITASTYLSGVVTLASAIFVLLLGFGRQFILLLAMVPFGGDTAGNPGPADSLRKLIQNESLGAAPDSGNATVKVTQAMDSTFRWAMRRLLNLVPNLERLSWTQHVAKGFNIPESELVLNFLGVCAYLFLWAVMGHYVFKWREIATW
jgi:ABC-type transport system involved in multi-copper enzyme maturation permease subunit